MARIPWSLSKAMLILSFGVSIAGAQTITGVVTAGGLPDVGATVTATAGTTSYSTSTTATGAFTLPVSIGVYTIDVEPSGAGALVYAGARIESRHVVTTLNVGTIALQLGYTLTGSVFYQGGLPVPNADTDVLDSVTGAKLFTPGDNTSLTGVYSVVVPAGTYRIVADPATGNYLSMESGVISVSAQSTSVIVPPIILPPGFRLTATIKDATTLVGIANVDIDVEDPVTNIRLQTPTDKTDATGLVSVVVPSGTWRINVDPSPGDSHLGVQILNVPITATTNFGNVLVSTGRIVQGYAKGGGVGILDASIDVDTALGPVRRYTSNDKTAHDGYFNISVPNGTYKFLATPPATTAYAPVSIAATTISANTTLPDIICPPGATLTGIITGNQGLESGVTVSLNDPVTNAPVTSTSSNPVAPNNYSRRVPLGTNNITYRPTHYSLSAALTVPVAVNANTTWNVQLPSSTILNFIAAGTNPTTIPHGSAIGFDAAVYNNTFVSRSSNLSISLLDPSGASIPVIAPFLLTLTPGQLILAPNVLLPLPAVNPTHYGYPFKLRFLITDLFTGAEIDRDDLVITIT